MPPRALSTRLAWTALLALVAVAAAGVAEWTGRSARIPFARPTEAGASRWIAVRDAGEGVRVLGEGGVRGRVLLLLTGRWPNVRSTSFEPSQPGDHAPAPDLIDADTASLAAARLGIARELAVVMTPAAFARRLDAVRGAKELVAGEGSFTLPYHGYPRRFSLPAAFAAPREPVVAIVEPSFFAEGAPADLDAWARERGIEADVGLVALADPEASPAQLARAAAFAAGHEAVALEVRR